MKLQKTKVGCYLTTLPRQIIEGMEWKPGDELETKILGKDRIEIKKK